MNRKIGVVLSYVMMVFEVMSTLLVTPFILRTLGQAEYGVYKLSSAIIAYLLLFDMGIGNSVIRYISKYKAIGNRTAEQRFFGVANLYYAVISVLALLCGVVFIFLFPNVFAKGLSAEEVRLGQKLLFVTMLNAAFTLGTAAYPNIIHAYERFAFAKGWSIIQILLRILFTVIVLKIGMGSIGIVSVNLAMTVFYRLICVFYVHIKLKLKPIFSGITPSFFKDIVSYSTFILLQLIATQINAAADQLLLGMFVSSSVVIIAVYGVGAQVVQYFQSIGSAFTGVLMPGIVAKVERGATTKQLCDEMVRIGRILFTMLSFIWVCFLFNGKRFILLWAGTENSNAYYVAVILMFAYVFILSESVGSQVLWAMNAHKEQSILKISIVVMNVFLTILLIKWNPLIGATIGTFISLIMGDVFIMNVIFKRKIKLSLKQYYGGLFKGIIVSLLITALCGGLMYLLDIKGWLGLVVNVSTMAAVFAACMFLFGFNKYEKDLLFGTAKKVLKKLHK